MCSEQSMDDFRALADALAADIAAGRLRPGDRLPTQRRFARDRGVAVSTASRVYGELVRRGLAVGEVGRGTYVRAGRGEPAVMRLEPVTDRVDLEMNFPILPDQAERLAPVLHGLLRPDALDAALRPIASAGGAPAREAAAELVAAPGWAPDPGRLLFAGSGRQGVAAAVSALVPPGGRLAVEALTYPVVRGIAARLGVDLVPLACDEAGLRPDALAACGPVQAVYLQPSLHNPVGWTMPTARRAELAELLDRLDVPAVEDRVYGFLRPDPVPLAALAPTRTIVVDSLSKRIAPGLTVGDLGGPPRLQGRVVGALRGGGWNPSAFALEAATRLAAAGAVARIEQDKRADAAARQRLVAERLAGFTVRADPVSYHCWWELPVPWRGGRVVPGPGPPGHPGPPRAPLPGRAPPPPHPGG